MKRKFLSVLLILVLACSFSLVTAVPSQVAAQGSEGVTLVATHAGIAEWSIAQQHIGDYSIHMAAPGKCDWGDWAGTYADALIQIPLEGTTLEGLTLNEIVDMSWWNYLVSGYPPALRIKLDIDGDGSSDYHLVGEFAYQQWDESGFVYDTPWVPYTHYKSGLEGTDTFYYPIYDTWMRTFHTTDTAVADPAGPRVADTVTATVHGDTIFWVMVVGGEHGVDWCSAPFSTGVGAASYFATLDDYKTTEVSNLGSTKTLPILGGAEVLMLEFAITNEIGPDVDPPGHEVYFDDLTINGEPYALELPAARPLTVDDDREQKPDAYFQTIQGAVDCALAGDNISVAPGMYNAVLIDKQLTLLGANHGVNAVAEERGPESIINAQGVPIAVLINGAETVATFDGFMVDNYDTIGVLAGAFKDTLQEVPLGDDPIAVHILNNIVKPPTVAPPHNNNIQVGGGTTGTVIGNEVSGALLESLEWSGSGILVASSSDIVISNNYVHNSEGGIQILGYVEYQGRPAAQDNVIENNLVEGNECGISVQGNSIGTIIRYNDLLNNDVGFGSMAYDLSWPEHSTPSGTQVHYNNIVDNKDYGVESVVWGSHTGNVLAEEVDATMNWWGGVAGPQHSTNPYNAQATAAGSDNVTDNVDYLPWIIHTELASGWNIYSTPIAPDASSDTIDKALNLCGSSSGDKEIAYYYNGETQYWDEPTSLTPLQAVYIKMAAAATIDVVVSSEATFPPSTDMHVGWNLVGPAELGKRLVDSALLDAYWGTGVATDLQGYSKALSPPLYQSNWTYLRDEVDKTDKYFVPTEGYWVLMVNQGILGGVTTTPIKYKVP